MADFETTSKKTGCRIVINPSPRFRILQEVTDLTQDRQYRRRLQSCSQGGGGKQRKGHRFCSLKRSVYSFAVKECHRNTSCELIKRHEESIHWQRLDGWEDG
ncbi:hypothetical protein CDAR_622931 [Caerostris darwini]|uniref:Uncharacterized protein n=1 Tax=Caerostris darwini TaxID=1538125 RepID=A0AAV4WL87_9ARAC|nr:hypothetical protein CDAR_622931 [Caerostris darwini]